MDDHVRSDLMLREWLEAARRGDTAFVVDYLRRGMNVNAGHDRTKVTALSMAVLGCQAEMIRLRLTDGGLRATVAPTSEGPAVMVFTEDVTAARRLLEAGT